MGNSEMIIVTNWEKVKKDDFYLSKDWEEDYPEEVKRARELQVRTNLYIAYRVPAVSYALYSQMDAEPIFINHDGDFILRGENEVIGNDFTNKWAEEE